MSNKCIKNMTIVKQTRLRLKRAIVVFIVVATLLLSSCAFLFDFIDIEIEHIDHDIDRIYLPKEMGLNSLQAPEGSTLYVVETAEDMFDAIQNELYMFSDIICFEIESFELFNQYWDELLDEAVLHSAFQEVDVYLEYDDKSPCLVIMSVNFNETGQVLHHYYNDTLDELMGYREIKLYNAVIDILDRVVDEKMTDKEIAIAIHDYIVINSQYVLDETRPELSTAYGILVNGEGQCQGYSEAYAILMRFAGVKTRVISGGALDRRAQYQPHAWNQVRIDDVWYHVDVTWNDPVPDLGDEVMRDYLLRSDEYFQRDHFWSDLFPEAPLDDPVV